MNTSHFAYIETGNLKEIKAFKRNMFDYIIITEPQKDEASILEIMKEIIDYLSEKGKVFICLNKEKFVLDNKFKKKLLDEVGNFKFEIIQVNEQKIFYMSKKCNEKPVEDMKLTFYSKSDLNQLHYGLDKDNVDVKDEYIKIIRRLDNNIDFENNIERLRMLIINNNIEAEELKDIILKNGIDKVNLLNMVGIIYYQFNNVDKALFLLREAFKLDNKNTDTIYNISYVLHKINKNELALKFLDNIGNAEYDLELQQLKQQIEEAI